jgi:2-dehydro-3-deoxygluconokinase
MTPDPVIALGEVMMVFNGPITHDRLRPGASFSCTFAGAEANVSIGLARLGVPVRYLTVLGEDAFGEAITQQLLNEKVDVHGIAYSKRNPTGVLFKEWNDARTPVVRYYRKGSAFAEEADGLLEFPSYGRLLFTSGITPSLSKGCLEMTRWMLKDARKHGKPVWLDPNYRAALWPSSAEFRKTMLEMLPFVDTILPGIDEARLLVDEQEPERIAAALMAHGVRSMILKAGERGAFAFTPAGNAHCDQFPLAEMVDPIGAGDAFDAGYLAAHLEGLPLAECLRWGHAVAARVCQTVGDWEGLPKREELERFLAAHPGG